jgi:hypothetical protein
LGHGWFRVDEIEKARQGLLEHVAALEVGMDAEPNGIGDVELPAKLIVEFADEKSFFRGFRKKEANCLQMTAGHHKNVLRPLG